MFEFWNLFKKQTDNLDLGIDFSTLSPQQKHNIIPYLIDRIDNNIITDVIGKIADIIIFNFTDFDNCYIANNYVVCDDCAYFTNPFNKNNIANAYEDSQINSNQTFSKIGIIAANHSIFNIAKKLEIIDNEANSLKFFHNLIKTATNRQASDIHIAPRNKTHIYFKFRIDGLMVDNLIDDIDIESYKLLANQILTQSKQESGNFIRILDAKFNLELKDIDISVRIVMMTTEFLFKNLINIPRFVIRIHDNSSTEIKSINKIGLNNYWVLTS